MRPGILAVLLGLTACLPVRAETDGLYEVVQHPGALSYLLHLPPGYERGSERYPLLFFLHGIAQKGDGSPETLERVADDGPFRTMREGRWDEGLPFIVVGPQSTGLRPWWRGAAVRDVLEHIMATYRVDPTRRYLTGISMGGRGVWWLAKNFSNEFAAIVPVSAWAGDLSRSCNVFRGMGIWAFHGADDPLIGLESGAKPVEVLNACRPALEPMPKLTVLPGVGHGQWRIVYENRHGDTDEGADGVEYRDIYRWMLTFAR
ncbi:MAG: alpha/beta hydrolase-fold protein [Pseudomonadales bacterium]